MSLISCLKYRRLVQRKDYTYEKINQFIYDGADAVQYVQLP